MLKKYQSHFKTAVVDGHRPDLASMEGRAQAAGTLRCEDGYLVYRRGYFARLSEALSERFEGVSSVLGNNRFHELTHEYISKTPSTSYSLSHYGENFALFLAKHPLLATYPFLAELARFETDFMTLFHKEQHHPLPLEQLATLVSDTNRRIVFSDSCTYFNSCYRVHEIWKNRHNPHFTQGEPVLGPIYLLMYKQESKIFLKEFAATEFSLLCALRDGLSLQELDSFASGSLSEQQMSALFQFIATSGIIVSSEPVLRQ